MSNEYARRKAWTKKGKTMGSKYRCETCDNKRVVNGEVDYFNFCTYSYLEPFIRCLVDSKIVERDEYKKICSCGCASHSTIKEILEVKK